MIALLDTAVPTSAALNTVAGVPAAAMCSAARIASPDVPAMGAPAATLASAMAVGEALGVNPITSAMPETRDRGGLGD